MEYGQKIKVYTDEIVGWEEAILIEQYQIVSENVLERWRMETVTGTVIVRYVKNSKELKMDGCGYLVH